VSFGHSLSLVHGLPPEAPLLRVALYMTRKSSFQLVDSCCLLKSILAGRYNADVIMDVTRPRPTTTHVAVDRRSCILPPKAATGSQSPSVGAGGGRTGGAATRYRRYISISIEQILQPVPDTTQPNRKWIRHPDPLLGGDGRKAARCSTVSGWERTAGKRDMVTRMEGDTAV